MAQHKILRLQPCHPGHADSICRQTTSSNFPAILVDDLSYTRRNVCTQTNSARSAVTICARMFFAGRAGGHTVHWLDSWLDCFRVDVGTHALAVPIWDRDDIYFNDSRRYDWF